LPIVVNAAAARLTGEYLSSGKAVALVLFAALLTLVFNVLRQLHCPWPLAVAMTGLLPATNTGLGVGSTVGGDVLPVVLQVGALLTLTVALRRNTLAGLLAAGVLAGLAVASKLTGAWAALALLRWRCFQGDWRRLVRFTIAWGATAALAFGVVQWTSQGRFLTTF